MITILERLKTLSIRMEEGLMALMLSVMILLATGQILLRNLFDTGLFWADPSLRLMVLWLALLGAIAATHDDRHIRIDLFSRFLSSRGKRISQSINDLFSAFVCAIISWHAGRLVYLEWQDGTQLFGSLPAWLGEIIIPIGFAIMAVRFFFSAPLRLLRVAK
ncbi:MAG: TRAP transporter small permease [Candidatus Thiodiazotropha sp. (ex Monitilora ramsayi)]|nr:TRAP transporter small permease [Candidatus Thiodiazotropha sp. (ex Monitilora ramsayi)]